MHKIYILSILVALLMLVSWSSHAQQITINIRYTSENGGAREYYKEMEESGIADRIRAVEGCIRYEYFFPANDPDGLLLIDEWADQEALNRYHASPMMKEAEALREKYKLSGRQVRMFQPVSNRPSNPGGQPRRTPPTL